ncbi:MAG TPA: hypothetical protein VJK53_02595 [Candidatus Paceibacterota bacterium]
MRHIIQVGIPDHEFKAVGTRTDFYGELDSDTSYDALVITNDLGAAKGVDVLDTVRTDEMYQRWANTRAAVISGHPEAIRSRVEAWGDTVVFSIETGTQLRAFFAKL